MSQFLSGCIISLLPIGFVYSGYKDVQGASIYVPPKGSLEQSIKPFAWLPKKISGEKETKEAGHALNSAAEHLELAAHWSGHKLEAGASKAISLGREVCGKLVQGTGYVSELVGKSLKNMGDAISGFGKKNAAREKIKR